MNALTPGCRQRLCKLIPLLSSDKSGEVVASAAAIGRTLESAGATWHDLAAAIVEHSSVSVLPNVFDIDAAFSFLLDECPLPVKRRAFVESLQSYRQRKGGLTPKQTAALRDIYDQWREAA